MTERRQRGLETLAEVYAVDLGITGEADPYQEFTVGHLFAEVWNRPGLEIAQRRLLVLGVVAALGRDDLCELNLYSALERGELTPEQVDEVVVHLLHYIGYPLGYALNEAAKRAISRSAHGKPTQPTTG
jgi:4-carboxymuconolactone decarboxylase